MDNFCITEKEFKKLISIYNKDKNDSRLPKWFVRYHELSLFYININNKCIKNFEDSKKFGKQFLKNRLSNLRLKGIYKYE